VTKNRKQNLNAAKGNLNDVAALRAEVDRIESALTRLQGDRQPLLEDVSTRGASIKVRLTKKINGSWYKQRDNPSLKLLREIAATSKVLMHSRDALIDQIKQCEATDVENAKQKEIADRYSFLNPIVGGQSGNN